MGSDQTTTPAAAKAFQVAQATKLELWVVEMTKFPRWFADFNPKTTGLVADFFGYQLQRNGMKIRRLEIQVRHIQAAYDRLQDPIAFGRVLLMLRMTPWSCWRTGVQTLRV